MLWMHGPAVSATVAINYNNNDSVDRDWHY